MASLYLTYTTITGTGYGDIVPVNSEGRIIAIIIMVLGVILLSFSSANVGMLVRGNETFHGHMLERKKVLTLALKRRNFPVKQIEKLRTYYKKSLEDQYFSDELKLVDKLPFKLRVDFCRFRFRDVMNRIPLFKYIKNDSVKVYLLLNVMQSETVESGVELIKFGARVEGCLFLNEGEGLICRPLPSVISSSNSRERDMKEDKEEDEEEELLQGKQRRSYTVDSRDCFFSRSLLQERDIGFDNDMKDVTYKNYSTEKDDNTDINDDNSDKTGITDKKEDNHRLPPTLKMECDDYSDMIPMASDVNIENKEVDNYAGKKIDSSCTSTDDMAMEKLYSNETQEITSNFENEWHSYKLKEVKDKDERVSMNHDYPDLVIGGGVSGGNGGNDGGETKNGSFANNTILGQLCEHFSSQLVQNPRCHSLTLKEALHKGYCCDPCKREVTMQIYGKFMPGDFTGPAALMAENEEDRIHQFSMITTQECVVYTLPQVGIKQLAMKHPEVYEELQYAFGLLLNTLEGVELDERLNKGFDSRNEEFLVKNRTDSVLWFE